MRVDIKNKYKSSKSGQLSPNPISKSENTIFLEQQTNPACNVYVLVWVCDQLIGYES